MKVFFLLLMALALTACDTVEVKREIGYKGKARINPWLAAERFCGRYEGSVRSLAAWAPPDVDDALWFVPASILSNETFTRSVEEWVHDGGHLVLLVEHADPATNDWGRAPTEPLPEPALIGMLERSGITLESPDKPDDRTIASEIEFNGETFAVDAQSKARVAAGDDKPGVFASIDSGEGRMTVLTDGRLLRNRWIGDKDHAPLLDALVRATDYDGDICFLRGSGASFWGLLGNHLWPVLVGLGVLTALWLWKNFTRFGPIESADGAATLRGYDHHLEALGNFQWRLDRGAALLAPLRTRILERGHHLAAVSGRGNDDLFQFLAERADLPRERIQRALAETQVPDAATLARTTADLQLLLQILH